MIMTSIMKRHMSRHMQTFNTGFVSKQERLKKRDVREKKDRKVDEGIKRITTTIERQERHGSAACL